MRLESPHPYPLAEEWLAAQDEHVRGLFVERGWPADQVAISLRDTPFEVFAGWVPEPTAEVVAASERLERMIAAVRIGLVQSPPMMGRELIDGHHRISAHVFLGTPSLPVYWVQPLGRG